MALEYRVADWDTYKMDVRNPHAALEPLESEIAVVDECLEFLQQVGVIPHTEYDHQRLLEHRRAVAEQFEIPWTAITHRQQRLIYALNAITQPSVMIAAGIFCGNTFISNAGAAVGPGAFYAARDLVGLEIKPEEAQRAEHNVRKLDPTGVARIVAADAVPFVADYPGEINLLYLDADGDKERGKGIYLEILQAGWDRLPAGSLVLAHNSVNCAERLTQYLQFVRDAGNMPVSVNVILDPEGLEVSVR
ncbi:MAG: O-methyltransferase [Armatimonadota bacterium]